MRRHPGITSRSGVGRPAESSAAASGSLFLTLDLPAQSARLALSLACPRQQSLPTHSQLVVTPPPLHTLYIYRMLTHTHRHSRSRFFSVSKAIYSETAKPCSQRVVRVFRLSPESWNGGVPISFIHHTMHKSILGESTAGGIVNRRSKFPRCYTIIPC